MRPRLPSLLTILAVVSAIAWGYPARAQVSDAERVAARELFHSGDELQRAGRFAEALDKFQRAQQVFRAPTNVLRIAECDAALGRLVESAEAYREVVRTPLPPDAPPAFQSAIEQARAELAQVEPRVPRIIVLVQPANAPNPQLQIDGQTVSVALLGEPLPLDPGPHKIGVRAAGYASAEEQIPLAEHETKTVTLTLTPKPAPPPPRTPAPTPTPAPAPAPAPASASAPALASAPPPPPPPPPPVPLLPPRPSRALLFGAHLGGLFPGGSIPTSKLPLPAPATTGDTVQASSIAQGGFVYGLDGGVRFTRQLYAGLEFDHAALGNGHASDLGVTSVSSNTTLLAAVLAFVVDPDRASFYIEVGVGARWLHLSESSNSTTPPTSASTTLGSAEADLGAGIWIPAGRNLRLLPKVSFTVGGFGSDDSSGSAAQHVFVTVGITGFYTTDL